MVGMILQFLESVKKKKKKKKIFILLDQGIYYIYLILRAKL